MTVQASLAEELACFQNPDDRFLALVRKNNDLDPPCLNVKYRICSLPLGEDDLILLIHRYRFPRADFCEKVLWVKRIPITSHIVLAQHRLAPYDAAAPMTRPTTSARLQRFVNRAATLQNLGNLPRRSALVVSHR
jgi:hypothetical protein